MASRVYRFPIVENGRTHQLMVTREGVGPLLTKYGRFHHFAFQVDDSWRKYSALVMADLGADFRPEFKNPDKLLLRIDSGCETGQLFGDETCECRQQLERAMAEIGNRGEGMIIHVPGQDGRGLGLHFKLATLLLQEELSVDTVQAAGLALIDPDGLRDKRTFAGAMAILKVFEIPVGTTLFLLTNNPKKCEVFPENGYGIETVPVVIPPTDLTRRHLAAKQKELGHKNLVEDEAGGSP